jgi:hypothetical protein
MKPVRADAVITSGDQLSDMAFLLQVNWVHNFEYNPRRIFLILPSETIKDKRKLSFLYALLFKHSEYGAQGFPQ